MLSLQNKVTKWDLNIFNEDYSVSKCDQSKAISGCNAIQRLVSTSRYYSSLDVVENADDESIFMSFICDVYGVTQCLDDFAHLVNDHNNLSAINKSIKCDKKKCALTTRHLSDKHKEKPMDGLLSFYVETMDSLHFYIYHLFEYGLRIEFEEKDDDDDDDDTKNDSNNKYFDKRFYRITQKINQRQHIALSFHRFKTNNKFNLKIKNENERESTFIDEMYRYLITKRIPQNVIIKYKIYIEDKQYDSDSIQMAIKIQNHGIGDKRILMLINDFIQIYTLRSSSFNIGFIFYYWSEYKEMKQFHDDSLFNINDHSGYKPCELFVKQKYCDFKEEMTNYIFISKKQSDALMIKVKQCLETNTAKKTTSHRNPVELKYDIKRGSNLLFEHILSVSLYTDFTELCTAFSATFRALTPFEPLSSIKKRNSCYWFMAKRLRETVELFGRTSYGIYDKEQKKYINKLHHPFYCGLSAVMPFPEFMIRFCGPTSTTKQISIATKFAGENGLIIELDNSVGFHKFLSGFYCPWISRFKSEDEVLYFGGHYAIKIYSVRIISGTNGKTQNFKQFFNALAQFNQMFNGSHTEGITVDDRSIISSLCDWKLGKSENEHNIDAYILQTFTAFCLNKQHIVFHYGLLASWNDEYLQDILFYEMKNVKELTEGIKENKMNILRNVVFDLFPKINNIDIYTTVGSCSYRFSFLSFLCEIQESSFDEIRIKALKDKYNDNKSWISSVWSLSSSDLKQKFKEKNLQIDLKNTKDGNGDDEDCIVINKM